MCHNSDAKLQLFPEPRKFFRTFFQILATAAHYFTPYYINDGTGEGAVPKYNHPRQKLSRMVTLKLVKNLK